MKSLALVLALIVALGATSVAKADKYDDKATLMKVEGTSTLHDWDCPVNSVKAKGDLTINNGELQSVNAMWVQADVKSIKSEKGEDMEEKIYDALKAEENPKITFSMISMKSIKKQGSEYLVETDGNMTIAGATKKIDLLVKGAIQPNGDVIFTGSTKIIMTQYGMERPSAMLGMIKCGDAIVVSFTLTLKKS